MSDSFITTPTYLDGPALNGFAVSPNDATTFPQPTRALYVGGSGTIVVRMVSGTVLTFASVSAGTILPIRVDRVLAAGTSASSIVGLF